MTSQNTAADSKTWTIDQVLKWSKDFLESRDFETPRLDAEQMLSSALDLKRIQLYTNFQQPLTEIERSAFRAMLKRRSEGEPVAYILGKRDFFKHEFFVNEDVLIPRSDTEVVLEKTMEIFSARSEEAIEFMDIGTGSGCLAVSLAKEFPQWSGLASDVSEKALDIAKKNAAQLETENLDFLCQDYLLEKELFQQAKFDLMISNPPYICHSEAPDLEKDVKEFEPNLALYAAQDGLEFYQKLSKDAFKALRPEGWLVVEIGYLQAAAVKDIFEGAGLKNVKSFKDYAKNDRIVVGQR